VGIVGVSGDFDAGDAVEVVAGDEVIGKGIVSYSSVEMAKVTGMKSAEVLELMPHAAAEAVHRDYFVLA
jgi:glutamate 5-kinase